jgi:hypothetical protein
MEKLEDCAIDKNRSKKAQVAMKNYIYLGYEKCMWKDGNANMRWLHQQEKKVSKHGFYP